MLFYGISKDFDLSNQAQYETIGAFWDEMSAIYGLENLRGLGYCWQNNKISYAIGLKSGFISGHNACIILPDDDWIIVTGKTDDLKQLYDKIYQDGPLQYEIETFFVDGRCKIEYHR